MMKLPNATPRSQPALAGQGQRDRPLGDDQNIYLLDKKNIARNKVQVIKQFEQAGTHANRYDVTILVNGLPLVQVELKKRGVAIREAFNQIHRYSKESFNSDNSLFKYLAAVRDLQRHRYAATLPTPPSATKTASTSR